ncbi:hypothetical protein [Rhodococcus phenolicus]|uniref:hypothetical protein n=1 Tax=Rhodococcus phenolicus TaxID=263849 RepID=UPI0008372467
MRSQNSAVPPVATRDVLILSRLDRPPFLKRCPTPLWRILRPASTRGFLWLTVGLYDPARA